MIVGHISRVKCPGGGEGVRKLTPRPITHGSFAGGSAEKRVEERIGCYDPSSGLHKYAILQGVMSNEGGLADDKGRRRHLGEEINVKNGVKK